MDYDMIVQMIHESPLTDAISMQDSLHTLILMLPPPFLAQKAFALPNKTANQIRAFVGFSFKHYLTGPRGCDEAMGFSTSKTIGSSGVQHNIFIRPCELAGVY